MSDQARCGDSGGLTKAGKPCRSTAIFADTGLCIQHDESRAEERRRHEEYRLQKISEPVAECQLMGCKQKPEAGNRYCTPEHRIRARSQRQQISSFKERVETTNIEQRRGQTYDTLVRKGYMPLLARGEVTMSAVAEELGMSVPAISRAVAAWLVDEAKRRSASEWERPDLPELTEDTVDAWVEAFIGFRSQFFQTRDGNPYITTDYMLRWVRLIFVALATGGRQAILSPPRHGKTELLTHVAIFLICYRPNINIMWLSKSEDVSKMSIRAIMDHLETNEELIEAFCPPGETFKPQRGRTTKQWSPSGGEFTIATRTIAGITSPTMAALSRTGTVRNRSADLIVVDDLEDHKSTRDDSQRQATREFALTELESRKEDHTAWFVIGSRAHQDDWYHYLIQDPEWEILVEEAHDHECLLDPLDEEAHVECMMWPEVRSYSWLMSKFRSAEAVGRRDLAEMVYLNRVHATGVRVFTGEVIDDCKDPSRGLGDIPPQTTLIGGLDPSGANYQAAFLWAFRVAEDPETRETRLLMWMVDIENRKGGGIRQARETVAAWYEKYRLTWWVVENNLYHGGIRDDERLSDFAATRGIVIQDYRTGAEKWDEKLGVSSMEPLFRQGDVNLPYADAEARSATDLYRAQLIRFSDETKTRGKRQSDLVMASWFPLERMRMELWAQFEEVERSYEKEYAAFDYEPMEGLPWQ